MENEIKWYAAFVETGSEDKVKERLNYRFQGKFTFYVPKRELRERKDKMWRIVNKILFPSYILICGDIEDNDLIKFRNVPGLRKILCSDGQPLTISRKEIDYINSLMTNGEIIGPSNIYEEGGQIKVIDGPLKGKEGQIFKIDKRKGRVKIKIPFLGEERIIDFSINIIGRA